MRKARWQTTIVDNEGNIVPGAAVEVRREVPGLPLATVYADREGTVVLPQPIIADEEGYVAFHADGGAYRIKVVSENYESEWPYVPIGLGAESDFSSAEFATLAEAMAYGSASAPPDYIRTTGYSKSGDGGGALYRRVDAEPGHPGKFQIASGQWYELAEAVVRLEMFGGGVDKTGSQNSQAFADAQAFLSVDRGSAYEGGASVEFLFGDYSFAETIQLKKAMHLFGKGAGHANSSGQNTRLVFPANTTGIIVHRHNTIDDTTEDDTSPGMRGADNSVIENLSIVGGGGTTPLPAAYDQDQMLGHGIWLRARAVLRNVYVTGFARNGIHIRASAGGGAAVEGNANLFYLDRVVSASNGWNGVYVDGADVNAGVGLMVNGTNNGLYGIYDSSFLGNTWVGCHTSANNKHGQVHYKGRRYTLVTDDTELGGATEPGTDGSVWFDLGAGGEHAVYPTWEPGGLYIRGGPYRADSNSARCVFVGCYSESGGGRNWIVHPNLVVGGLFGAFDGSAGVLASKEIQPGTAVLLKDGAVIEFGEPNNNFPVAFRIGFGSSDVWRFRYTGETWDLNHANASGRTALRLTTNATTISAGRAAAIGGGYPIFPRGMFVGPGPRQITYATAAPTSGNWARGDIVLNQNPVAGGNVGWVCVTAGAPGTWKTFGQIEE